MFSSIERFTSRVENYVRYRPSYPAQVLELLEERCGLDLSFRIADVGSGTGILTQMLLQTGAEVWGVEPNERMRAAAEGLLGSQDRFHSVAGTAEETRLPAASVDLITAGQAFHWFDVPRSRAEFLRILVPQGWVALIWNDRPPDATSFLIEYDEVLHRYSSDYQQLAQQRRYAESPESARILFGGDFEIASFPNLQSLDFQGLVGRALSSSYTPEPGEPQHVPMVAGLREVFQRHAVSGEIVFTYETRMYLGRLQG
jgi:SAM-dependent methyltransferase